jgi:hypothetical protein
LSNHPGLRALRERRRRDEIQNKLEDSKPLKEILEDILKKSPALSSLLVPGFKIKNPFDMRTVIEQDEFIGREYPTYFRIRLEEVKQCPIKSKFRIQYETDATNDYFERGTLPGEFRLCVEKEETTDYILNLWNGLATLTVGLPDNAQVGDTLEYESIVNDPTQLRPFKDQFLVKALGESKKLPGGHGERKKPPAEKEGDDRSILSSLALPLVIEVYQNQWLEFGFNEKSALEVKDTGEDGYDFYVNMDNICLLTEIKAKSEIDAKLLKERYKYALVLIGLALLKEHPNGKEQKEQDGDIFKGVSETTVKLSPIILPMISYLGELEIES